MDRHHIPQSFTSAGLNISTPRPLRPHGQEESITTNVSNITTAGHHVPPRQHPPVIPYSGTPMFGYNHELPVDEHGVIQSAQFTEGEDTTDAGESRPETMNGSEYRGSWMDRGFLGTLIRGLGRTRRAMEKHHSRQSLYEEHMAEARASALRASQMSPNGSQPLEDIPESAERDIVESHRGQPSSDTYDGTTAVNHNIAWPQPVWPVLNNITNSETPPISQYSERASSFGPLPPEDTWAYYCARIVHFLIWLRGLPWSEERIVNDFVPARDGRGGFGKQRPANQWYKPKSKKEQFDNEKLASSVSPPMVLVLPATPVSGLGNGPILPPFASNGPPVIPAPVIPSPFSDSAATAIRPTHTPRSVTSAGLSYMSPGMSSHGQGRQELTYSWYSGPETAQAWQSYFPQFLSPQTNTQSQFGTDIYSSDGRYIDR